MISTLVQTTFPSDVERTLTPQPIPEEYGLTSDLKLVAVDVSPYPADTARALRALKQATVVCLLYDASKPETFERVQYHWLPHLRDIGMQVCSLSLSLPKN